MTLLTSCACLTHAVDPDALIQQADALAWKNAWAKAEPLYAAAAHAYSARGDRRNALYAEVSALRGQSARLSASDASERVAAYLSDPMVRADDQLRFRCLVIKSAIDTNLDPVLAERSLREALALARTLREPLWTNRLQGELAIVAFLQGNVGGSIVALGNALKATETNGDVAAQIRFLTLFGQGYTQMGRADDALSFYDRALRAATTLEGLDLPVMTYLGKAAALATLGRDQDAEALIHDALGAAQRQGSAGYQAELTMLLGSLAAKHGHVDQALAHLAKADDLARQADANRIREELAEERGRVQRAAGQLAAADISLEEGVRIARAMQDRMVLPRLLAQLATVRATQGRVTDGASLLEEASDLLEGLLAHVSSPWLRARLIHSMDEVFAARITMEGQRGAPARVFAVVEQARARSLSDLLAATRAVSEIEASPELREGEKILAGLQTQLFHAVDRGERQRLLEAIFVAEERLAPSSTDRFDRTQTGARPKATSLEDLQHALRPDETFLEIALGEPTSFALLASRDDVRLVRLEGRQVLETAARALLGAINAGQMARAESRALGALLADVLVDAGSHRRLVISGDGELHRVPFELLPAVGQEPLIESRVVSYTPSGTVFVRLRGRAAPSPPPTLVLAVSASASPLVGTRAQAAPAVFGAVSRGVYDVDAAALPELPSANAEAREVAQTLGAPPGSVVLLAAAATEANLKGRALDDFAVMHFALHGILSTKFPERSALVLRASGDEDGLLQAREILGLRLRAVLVTLSACESGNGSVQGQDGVASLVRPFLAAGARAVVANLWSADDRFSLALMKEFYRQLHAGAEKGDALRDAKLTMLRRYGSEAIPKLWAGLVMHGDSAGALPAPLLASK
ncbi:MAG: CHAT domain-containing protein [Acidobacteriota bacterium]